ncbi:hypothetical protein VU08_00670, partial [Desulfobulbus sp. F5]|nr:hypothetical protein [Desulfobulbus sp. F5]
RKEDRASDFLFPQQIVATKQAAPPSTATLTFRLLRAGISVTLAGFACALHNEQHRNPARCMLTGCKNNYNYQEGGTIED